MQLRPSGSVFSGFRFHILQVFQGIRRPSRPAARLAYSTTITAVARALASSISDCSCSAWKVVNEYSMRMRSTRIGTSVSMHMAANAAVVLGMAALCTRTSGFLQT